MNMFPSIEIILDPAIAELSSQLHPDEEAGLEASLVRDGCRDPLAVYRNPANQVILLDGHRRLCICRRQGLAFSTREIKLKVPEDALAWVVENHLLRRNLNESQRAMFGAQLATMRPGARTDLAPNGGRSQTAAAQASNASTRSIQRATLILRDGAPELIRACRCGILSVSVGAVVSELPHQEQEAIARACLASGDAKPARHALAARRGAVAKEADVTNPRQNGQPRFSILLADPFRCRSRDGASEPTTEKDQPVAIPLKKLNVLADELACVLAPDTMLFLWTDGPHLAEAIELLSTWQFEYCGNLVAVIAEGMRSLLGDIQYEHQLILLGTRGTYMAPDSTISSILSSDDSRLIGRIYPYRPKLALFVDPPPTSWHWWNEAARTVVAPEVDLD
jgi:N6-adenosine-specific RNA methylase IME4